MTFNCPIAALAEGIFGTTYQMARRTADAIIMNDLSVGHVRGVQCALGGCAPVKSPRVDLTRVSRGDKVTS